MKPGESKQQFFEQMKKQRDEALRCTKQFCIVDDCDSSKKTCKLFDFPRDIQRCKIWARNLHQSNPSAKPYPLNDLWDNYSICSRHFEKNQFIDGLQKLKDIAVPRIFPSHNKNKNQPKDTNNVITIMDDLDPNIPVISLSTKDIVHPRTLQQNHLHQIQPNVVLYTQANAQPANVSRVVAPPPTSSSNLAVGLPCATSVVDTGSPYPRPQTQRDFRVARLDKLHRKVSQRRVDLSHERGQLEAVRRIQRMARQRFRGLDVGRLNPLQRRLIFRMAKKWTLNNITEDDKKIVEFSHSVYINCQRSYEYLNGWLMFPTARFQGNMITAEARKGEYEVQPPTVKLAVSTATAIAARGDSKGEDVVAGDTLNNAASGSEEQSRQEANVVQANDVNGDEVNHVQIEDSTEKMIY